jgi:hypothetical protein
MNKSTGSEPFEVSARKCHVLAFMGARWTEISGFTGHTSKHDWKNRRERPNLKER